MGVYAYSYGAGWGAMRLATALRRRGIAVDEMVLSDPVYRHGCRSLAWLSLVRGPRIRVPANVKRLTWFYQRTNRPAGHALVDAAGHPVPGLFVPGVIHQAMDDLPAFHEACRAAALSLHALRESLEAQPAATSSLVLPGAPLAVLTTNAPSLHFPPSHLPLLPTGRPTLPACSCPFSY